LSGVFSSVMRDDLLKYWNLIEKGNCKISCANQLKGVARIHQLGMVEKALFQRLSNKNELVYQLLARNKNDWEETSYQLLLYNFGFKVNSDTFLDLSKSLPLKILKKHYHNLHELEALLLGRAGFLDEKLLFYDNYTKELTKTYEYLSHKYSWSGTILSKSQWKFFRLRPANFPTIRIAQLAKILYIHQNIFYMFIDSATAALKAMLSIKQSDYWQRHYQLGKQSNRVIPGLGKDSVENILINTGVPLLVAYGKATDQTMYVDKAVQILKQLPPEFNHITKLWKNLGLNIESAFDSQGSIELFNNFCVPKKCLSCNIGTTLMQRKQPSS